MTVAFLAAIVSFSAYTCIFSFRKAFNVAAYQGYTLWGIDYKIVLVITQVFGYMLSKFYGIRFIAELKRIGRGKLIILLVGISWAAWLLFALLPAPYNFWCLFLNGFPLGMLWGIVFSYVEGRRTTDLISASLAVSFIFASGLAKSVAQYLMSSWNVSEYWMPFVTGLVFMPPLLLFVYLLEKIPAPDDNDKAERTERLPMTKERRWQLVKEFYPGLTALVLIYILITILREIRDNFMADMWRESGELFQPAVFAKTETIISIIILVMIASMVLVRNNFRAFLLAQIIMLAGFVLALLVTFMYTNGHLNLFTWMTTIGLGLYMVYIPFNSILFDRFIAAFRYAGNTGFLIYIADSFGYLGSVGVLLSRSLFSIKINWLSFYTGMVSWVAVFGIIGVVISMIYFVRKKKGMRYEV
ncbi:MAG: DUF5690 family protein [Chitinophagaceae bacterium]